VRAVAIDPQNSSLLYAATAGGVFKSTDAGATWAPANSGRTNTNVLSVDIDRLDTQQLVVGTSGGGAFRSTNRAGAWTQINNGLANLTVPPLAVNTNIQGTLYAGTAGGVFATTDFGSTWTTVNSGLTNLDVRAVT